MWQCRDAGVATVMLCMAAVSVASATRVQWGYDGSPFVPPDRWGEIYPLCRDGQAQSPIDLGEHEIDSTLQPLAFEYGSLRRASVENTGRGMRVVLPMDLGPQTVEGGPLPKGNLYRLAHIEFHWGPSSDTGGTSHAINGRRDAMEMHLVHYRTTYSSLGAASGTSDGVIIIAIRFVAGAESDTLSPIFNLLPAITASGTSTEMVNGVVALSSLLPGIDYYTYTGSMVYPPCSEDVQWIVLSSRLSVSTGQMDLLRALAQGDAGNGNGNGDGNGNGNVVLMKNTVRPLQRRFDRVVRKSELYTLGGGSIASIAVGAAVLLAVVGVFVAAGVGVSRQDVWVTAADGI